MAHVRGSLLVTSSVRVRCNKQCVRVQKAGGAHSWRDESGWLLWPGLSVGRVSDLLKHAPVSTRLRAGSRMPIDQYIDECPAKASPRYEATCKRRACKRFIKFMRQLFLVASARQRRLFSLAHSTMLHRAAARCRPLGRRALSSQALPPHLRQPFLTVTGKETCSAHSPLRTRAPAKPCSTPAPLG